ncbi:MAG: (R)-specific enoyl-CoA hydratase [Chloroflexi bacterium]|nr:(R)-specific enoyl-CoA hydratase [Chloroflexota bacterium]
MSNTHQVRTDFQIGEKAQLSKIIQESDLEIFAKVTGDHNPLHLDENFAKKTRFSGRIAHGILGVGLISAVLGTQLPGPGAIYLSQSVNFLAPVRIGDKITAEVEVTKWKPDKNIIHLETRCFNQDEVEVLSGKAVLLIEDI